jgi:(S)-mandelate dehydrogenase
MINVSEYRDRAKKYLPKGIFDFIDGGAEDESCLKRNFESFSRLQLIPKLFRDVSHRNLHATIFDKEIAAPIIVAPTGLNGMIRTDGDLMLARAAAKANIPFVLSTPAGNSIEQVAESIGGVLWFQLYFIDRHLASDLVQRANVAGYEALVVTVDTVVSGRRERDLHNRFRVPLNGANLSFPGALTHPRWLWDQRRRKQRCFANLPETSSPLHSKMASALSSRNLDATISWDDLKLLRDEWPRYLIVKGAMGLSDLKECERLGIDAVALSNHGGRQLDSVPTALEMLVAYRTETRMTLLIDGGIRRGSDIVKALALGADSVLAGRPFLYGLASDGEAGAAHVLEIFKEEIDRTLALIGCSSVNELDHTYLFYGAEQRVDSEKSSMAAPTQKMCGHR